MGKKQLTFFDKQILFYNSLRKKPIYCELLKELVHFNADGLYHLLNESNRQPRVKSEIHLKLSCLDYVLEVISKAIQLEEREIKKKAKGKLKEGKHFTLVYTSADGFRVKVVLEKLGQGQLNFHSIMPRGKSRPNNKKKHP